MQRLLKACLLSAVSHMVSVNLEGCSWKNVERQNQTQQQVGSKVLVLLTSPYTLLTPRDLFLEISCDGHYCKLFQAPRVIFPYSLCSAAPSLQPPGKG